jgi:hypothetical protein
LHVAPICRMEETESALKKIGTMLQELEEQQEDVLGKTLDEDLKTYNVSTLANADDLRPWSIRTDEPSMVIEQEAAAPMIDQLKDHVNTYLAQHGTAIIDTGDASESILSLCACTRAQEEKPRASYASEQISQIAGKGAETCGPANET